MIKLNVKDRGYVIHIPGIAPFRSPGKVDISSTKISLVLTTLHNLGVQKYEIVAVENGKETVYTEKDLKKPKKKKKEDFSKINDRFNKLEEMIYALAKKQSNKPKSQEQITNKLNALEELSKRILEKEAVREIVYTSSEDKKGEPIIEELDDEKFIPDIDLSELELKGSSSQVIGETEDVEEAADMLSRLKK